MKYISDKRLLILCFTLLALLIPISGLCEEVLKAPDIIGNTNNPYILPDGSGPGFLISAAIGLVAGMLSSSIGAGGGFIVVPALMTAGISGIYAVGSEIFRLFLFSTIEAVRMGFHKRINYTFALILTAGTTVGGLAGFALSSNVFLADPAGNDVFISSMIILWLIVYSFIIVPDFREASHKYALALLRKQNAEKEKEAAVQMNSAETETKQVATEDGVLAAKPSPKEPDSEKNEIDQSAFISFPDEEPWEIARTIRTMKFPPYVNFPGTVKDDVEELELAPTGAEADPKDAAQQLADLADGQPYSKIPVIPALILATLGGFFMALTGSGGIILSFTILTRGFGCVAAMVAGTDLLGLAASSGVLTFGTFGLKGFINIYCITGLIFGTMTGIHLGGKAIRSIEPYRIKGLVSLLVISVIINRLLSLPGELRKSGASISHNLTTTLDQSALYIMIIGMVIFCGWLFYSLTADILSTIRPPKKEGAAK
ncbi:Sulfite exporter TauE/SafE [Maridesulfovibrio ferrireducens]|uniref:Probable membrane transporter protein n=1 Tax=Maridesulfovibrio ferrireducens TaxID=246191 RepID=A0A1G9FBH4_9BACT|nr:TSUP family transporter [Maridesulfovibrio ferrireducens]SDK85668.1 Sulfite exporter TauE/SafE [Maridesulfovibrio ferrireducens]